MVRTAVGDDDWDDHDEDDEEEENTAWAAYRAEIARRLDHDRPPRAGAWDKAWRERVYGWARNHIPDESNIVRTFAEREVNQVEGKATREGTKILRSWAKGHRPLIWWKIGPIPVRVGKERVRLDALTPDDIDKAGEQMFADGLATWEAIQVLVAAMKDLGRAARRHRYAAIAQLGDLAPLGESRRIVRLREEGD